MQTITITGARYDVYVAIVHALATTHDLLWAPLAFGHWEAAPERWQEEHGELRLVVEKANDVSASDEELEVMP